MARFGELIFEQASRIAPGPAALRDTVQPDVAGGADRLAVMGRAARTIVQRGVLLADTPAALQQQLDIIAASLDGVPCTLTDDHGAAWVGLVLRRLEPTPAQRVGMRWRMRFTAHYLQLVGEEQG